MGVLSACDENRAEFVGLGLKIKSWLHGGECLSIGRGGRIVWAVRPTVTKFNHVLQHRGIEAMLPD